MFPKTHQNIAKSPPPFGTPLYNRGFTFSDYKYGFNGKEKDDELMGSGNCIDYGFRVNDTRLGGRFFSIDPLFKKYPELTPYQFASNNPIEGVDLDGLELFSNKNLVFHTTTALTLWTAGSVKQAQLETTEHGGSFGTNLAKIDAAKIGFVYGTVASVFLPAARVVQIVKGIEEVTEARMAWQAAEILTFEAPAMYKTADKVFGSGTVEYSNLPGQITNSAKIDLLFTVIAIGTSGPPKNAVEVIGLGDNLKTANEDRNKILDDKKTETPPPANTATPPKSGESESKNAPKKDTKSKEAAKKDSTPPLPKKRCEKKDNF